MKVAAATTLVSVVLASQQLGSVTASNCLAACQSEVMTHQVQDCTVWRERLPCPDLYSLCQDDYDLGLSAGCEGYCAKEVNEGKLASLRLDACTFLRGTPPMDRMRACQSDFTSAVKRAKDAAVVSRQLSETVADSMDNSESEKPKKKVTIKKTVEARNILELAREEAQAAFQTDTRATEL